MQRRGFISRGLAHPTSLNGWTGEDWIARLFRSDESTVVFSNAASGTSISVDSANELIASDKEKRGDILNFANAGLYTVSKINGSTLTVDPAVGVTIAPGSAGRVNTSVSRAWRAWMRNKSATDYGVNLEGNGGPDGKIMSKQPAYYIFQQYHDVERFTATGTGAISMDVPTSTGAVIYWKADRIGTTASKPAESAQTATVNFP